MAPVVESASTEGLSDSDIAKNLLAQAKGYETEAKNLKVQHMSCLRIKAAQKIEAKKSNCRSSC